MAAKKKTAAKKRPRPSGPSGTSGRSKFSLIGLRPEREGQVDEWRAAARRADMSLSAWIRAICDREATGR